MQLYAAFFLLFSGVAALTYQVTWVRLLGLSMGSTSASISTVLAAFFLGMALGSYLAERISRNRIHSLAPYIVLEMLIGLSALALLPLLLNLDWLMALVPSLGQQLGFKFVIAMLLLLTPTLCMGATFPVMAAILVRSRSDVGLRISQLYALNTFGAVLGALFSGFVFIPAVGLDGAIYLAVGLNLLIAVSALWLNGRIRLQPLPSAQGQDRNEDAPRATLALLALFVTGFASIATEVGWTKYLSIFTGTTIYGFAAILAVFLSGIAAGSWAVRRWLEKLQQPQAWLAAGLIAVGLTLLLTRAGLSLVPAIYEGINHLGASGEVKQLVKYGLIFLILFPATFLFGAIFPLNLKLYCGGLHGVRSRIGRAYAINTVAAIAGSLAAGFWLIPVYGTNTLLSAMALLPVALGLLFLMQLEQARQKVGLALASLLAAALVWALPDISYQRMISSVQYKYDEDAIAGKKPEFLFLKEGKSGVISMISYDGEIAKVQSNGLNESMIDINDPHNALILESLLAYMPYLLHPSPRDAFVVGFGGGVTTRAFSHTGLESIRVVELEPAVVAAANSVPTGPVQALADPRVQVEFNDARNTLMVETRQYDLIAAQPSHPWLAGAANVFTEEFFTIVASRLREGGIYSQWINLFRMDVTTLRGLFAAFYNVFPHGFSFANLETGDLMLIGSGQPLRFDLERMAERMAQPDIKETLARYDVHQPLHLFWYYALSRDEALAAAAGAVPNRDTNILSEVRLSALTDPPTGEENPYPFLFRNFGFDLAPYLESGKVADSLFTLGRYFLEWYAPDVTEKIIQALGGQDELAERSLRHELLWWQAREGEADGLYASHDRWRDETHARQAEIEIGRQAYDIADRLIARIQDAGLRHQARGLWLYAQQRWTDLARLPGDDDYTRRWRLVGRLEQGDRSAAQELASLLNDSGDEHEAQLASLMRHHANEHDQKALQQLARRLVTRLDSRAERLSHLIEAAMEASELSRAEHLLERLGELAPDHENLKDLQIRLARQQREARVAMGAYPQKN